MIFKEGLTYFNGDFIFNYDSNSETDIITFTEPQLYKSNVLDNIYYFGYKFNDNCSRQLRSKFIDWLKNQNKNSYDLTAFILRPLRDLAKKIPLENFNALIYPVSEKSKLVNIIIDLFSQVAPNSLIEKSYEAIKNIPSNILFDWDRFNANYDGSIGDTRYMSIYSYIEEVLMPKIHDLSYFSIADNVKTKYRKYIQDFLVFKDKNCNEVFSSIVSGNIIIIDDINTSGSTINELLRIISAININCEVYIFTLIGKE